MLKEEQFQEGAKVIVLAKTSGVSLTKSNLKISDTLFLVKKIGDPWNNPDGYIEASHNIGDKHVFNFRPEDLQLA